MNMRLVNLKSIGALLENVPASSITSIVYENVLKLLKQPPRG